MSTHRTERIHFIFKMRSQPTKGLITLTLVSENKSSVKHLLERDKGHFKETCRHEVPAGGTSV